MREVRRDWDNARLTALEQKLWLPCVNNPIPYTEVRQTAEAAEDLCFGCPLVEIHEEYGHAAKLNGEVAGGKMWVRGKPLKKLSPETLQLAS